MFKNVIAAAFVTGFFALLPASAPAMDDPCTDRSNVVKQLSAQYSEKPVAMGLANNGGIIELLHSKDRTTWTLIITMPNGQTCPVAAGESWEVIQAVSGSQI
ncbi:MAG TPA: hypothetical protein VLN73_00770 [Alphaproteobacteria bacterium]|nr:hypothetical protein [Alphaproteobacteria bacterium]